MGAAKPPLRLLDGVRRVDRWSGATHPHQTEAWVHATVGLGFEGRHRVVASVGERSGVICPLVPSKVPGDEDLLVTPGRGGPICWGRPAEVCHRLLEIRDWVEGHGFRGLDVRQCPTDPAPPLAVLGIGEDVGPTIVVPIGPLEVMWSRLHKKLRRDVDKADDALLLRAANLRVDPGERGRFIETLDLADRVERVWPDAGFVQCVADDGLDVWMLWAELPGAPKIVAAQIVVAHAGVAEAWAAVADPQVAAELSPIKSLDWLTLRIGHGEGWRAVHVGGAADRNDLGGDGLWAYKQRLGGYVSTDLIVRARFDQPRAETRTTEPQ